MQSVIQTIQSKLGNVRDLVVAEHNDNGHFYRHLPTGLLLPSVTTKTSILDGGEHLKKWAARLAVEKLTEKILLTPDVLQPGKVIQLQTYQHEAILCHQDQFEDAGGIGTIGHKYIELYLKDWIDSGVRPSRPITSYIKEGEDTRAWAITRSAEAFMNDFYAIPIATEFFVASVKHKYAGTLDGLMMVLTVPQKCTQMNLEGKIGDHVFFHRSSKNLCKMECIHCHLQADYQFALTDWKTSNQIDKASYALQVSAYWEALREMTGLKPKELIIIRLDKKQAKYDVMKVLDHHKAFKAFLAVTRAYDWLENGKAKMHKFVPKEIINVILPSNVETKTNVGNTRAESI